MRDGLPVEGDITSRLDFIVQNLTVWKLGWFMWMASALGLLLFATILAGYLPSSFYKNFALAVLSLGIAPDLIAEVIYTFIIPKAYLGGTDISTLAMMEQIAIHLTGFLGNGLYNIGGLLLTFILLHQNILSKWIVLYGLASWILGIGLSISIAMGSMAATELLTATSMFLNTSWMFILANSLFKNDHIYDS